MADCVSASIMVGRSRTSIGCLAEIGQQLLDAARNAAVALEDALAESLTADETTANRFVKGHLPNPQSEGPLPSTIDLDFTEISWEAILQDIVRRSSTLTYVSAVSSFTCSRMRADGFGGAVVVITADAILGKSTNDLLEEFIDQVVPVER